VKTQYSYALGTAAFAAFALAPNQHADTDGNREMNRRLVEQGHGNALLREHGWFPQASKEYHPGLFQGVHRQPRASLRLLLQGSRHPQGDPDEVVFLHGRTNMATSTRIAQEDALRRISQANQNEKSEEDYGVGWLAL
jgi:hypothetical protein